MAFPVSLSILFLTEVQGNAMLRSGVQPSDRTRLYIMGGSP